MSNMLSNRYKNPEQKANTIEYPVNTTNFLQGNEQQTPHS